MHAAHAGCHSYANRRTHKKFQHTFKIPPSALFLHQTSLVTFISQFPRAPAVVVKTPPPNSQKKKKRRKLQELYGALHQGAALTGCTAVPGDHTVPPCAQRTPLIPLGITAGQAPRACSPIPTSPTPQELQGAPKGHRRSRAAQLHLCTWPSGETTLPGQTNFFFFFILFLAFFCCFLRAERSEVQDDFSAAPSPARLQKKNKTWGANPTRCCGASKQRAGSTTPKSNYGISVVFIRAIDARSWESFLGGRKQDIDF